MGKSGVIVLRCLPYKALQGVCIILLTKTSKMACAIALQEGMSVTHGPIFTNVVNSFSLIAL